MDNSLSSLLSSLTAALQSATEAVPKDLGIHTENGISLFDVKNELFLSYLQNLVFLIKLKIRSALNREGQNTLQEELWEINDVVVKKLVELRLYLDKGVKPLEGRLKYQIDSVVRAAEESSRPPKRKLKGSHMHVNVERRKQIDGLNRNPSEEGNSDEDSSIESESDIDELALRPNAAGLLRAASQATAAARQRDSDDEDGLYRPPRINPVSMPTTERKVPRDGRPEKSATLDEFVADEYSTAPRVQPSIGSTIAAGGRLNKSQRERDEDAERKAYEEANLVRLPVLGKKERAKKAAKFQSGFGGEEWRDLDAGLDRIGRLTQGKAGGGISLARSQKRKFDTLDGPRGSGEQIGTSFQKRKRNIRR